ncbi:hypothetical protein AAA799O18_00062 [Marine Group I thaumarchaeote SCGC AAA799-O18]|nr:hypothetical protein AAA799O18_00062 [Marine Group I thaumarchaeote SCGC AAA799-O18]
MPYFEISTTKYDEDVKTIQVAITKMAALCDIDSGFKLGEPISKFGWTFFQILVNQELYFGIEDKFSDMIRKCKGSNQDEKFTDFLTSYFESRGCNVKVKMKKD